MICKLLKMNLKSLKSRVNNQKGCVIKGKSTKSSVTFRKNKANFKNIKIGASSLQTNKYETLPAWRGEKTNPNKANSNPIPEKQKMNISTYFTSRYNNKIIPGSKKTNPMQTQNKPNFIFFLSQNYPNVHYIARTRIINNFLRCCYV